MNLSPYYILIFVQTSLFFRFSLSSSGGMINAAEVSNYSGSGSGLPLLIQRSVARQISLINVIGNLGNYIQFFNLMKDLILIFQ